MPKRLQEMEGDERERAILAYALRRKVQLKERELGRALGMMKRVNGDTRQVLAACLYAKRSRFPLNYAAGCLHRGGVFEDSLLLECAEMLDQCRDEIILSEGGSSLSMLKGIGDGRA